MRSKGNSMTKKILCSLVLTMLLFGLMVISAAAKVDPKLDANDASGRIDQFNLNKLSRQDLRIDAEASASTSRRIPLGATSVSAGIGIGEVVDNTWFDFQDYMHNGHFVGSGNDVTDDAHADVGVEVHFTYEELPSIDTLTQPNYYKAGYNFYNATNAGGTNWPEGQEAGCQLDGLHEHGAARQPNLAMMPDGRVAFAANSNMRSEHNGEEDSTTGLDNQIFFQQDKSSFNRCYWDSTANTSVVPSAIYEVGWVTADDDDPGSAQPRAMETQIIGTDTIIHLLMFEGGGRADLPGYPVLETHTFSTISYFRKVGSGTPGTWSAATVIDTNSWYGAGIAASPFDAKVTIATSKVSLLGRLQENESDRDVYFTESPDGGLNWPALTNLTDYPRNAPSYTAGLEIDLMYDSRGYLHIVWAAQPCPADPYRGGYHWPDFARDFFHWSNAITGTSAGGTISMIQYASFDVNPAACSFGGYNAAQLAWFNLTECDGNLYALYNMWHFRVLELGIVPEAYDDCPETIENTTHSANAEIVLNVSSTLDGLLWDAPRNLTNTYTPGCDSLGGEGGPCGHEYKPGAERYALDPTGLGTLTWPTASLVDPGPLVGLPAYTGDRYFNAMYIDDQYPGEYSVGNISEFPFFNSMKWLRIACVNPVEAPQIDATPTSLAWPRWQRYNEDSAYTITVTNQGNVSLVISEIATSGEAWLGTSVGSMTVSAGASPDNQSTFDIDVNTAGFSAPQFLDGEVYLISNVEPTAPATVDTLTVTVHLLVADTVEPVVWDTVATSSAWDDKSATASGDNTALAMSNFGEMGQNGQLGVNLDFGVDGNDPGTRGRDSMYLYTGSMFLMRDDGGSISLTTSIQQTDQATSGATNLGYPTDYSFDAVPDGGTMSGGVRNDGGGDIYDSVYTGRMASRDTAVYVERTFYAPRNQSSTIPNFVVVKSKVFTGTKGAQSGLSIGDVMDWDIPTDEPPKNVSATSILGDVTYMQGTVHPESTFTWDNSQRYAAEAMMGWATTNVTGDCSGDSRDYHGSFGTFQPMMDDTLIAPGVNEPNAQMWWDSVNTYDYNSGNSSDTDQTMWMTYMHDFSLTDSDTLYFYTAFAMVKQGTVGDLEATITAAYNFYYGTIRGCSEGCCLPPTVGDCDQSGGVDITDISVLIDNQFLTLTPLVCEVEGDVDFSGGVDITDLSVLIDNQFLTLTPLKDCDGNPVP